MDPKLNGFLYHLPLASSSPHEDAPWHHYSSTAAWSWQEQHPCNSPTGSQLHWLRSPWIWSGQYPWIPSTGEKQGSSSEEHISAWIRGILPIYVYGSQLRKNLFPLQGKVQFKRGTTAPTTQGTCFSHRLWGGRTFQFPPRETNSHINNSSLARKLAA